MKLYKLAAIALFLLASSVTMTTARAQDLDQDSASTTAPSSATSYEGKVSAATADGFTIMSRYGDRSITVKTSADTRYKMTTTLTQDQLAVGQTVFVLAQASADKKEVDAGLIYVMPDGVAGSGAMRRMRKTKVGGAKKYQRMLGKITAVSPDITIETDDGPVALTLLPRAIIMTRSNGSPSDIKPGTDVTVHGSTSGDMANEVVLADTVEVKSGLLEGKRGLRLKKAAAAATTPSAAAPTNSSTL